MQNADNMDMDIFLLARYSRMRVWLWLNNSGSFTGIIYFLNGKTSMESSYLTLKILFIYLIFFLPLTHSQ